MYRNWPTEKADIKIVNAGDGSMRAIGYCFGETAEASIPAGERLVIEAMGGKQVVLFQEPIPKPKSIRDKRKELLSLLLNTEPDAEVTALCEAIIRLLED